MQIGPYKLKNNVILAPMAGITDLPFRQICAEFGAGAALSEMVGAISLIRNHAKTIKRTSNADITNPKWIQIVGADPKALAEAAKINEAEGTDIIDINMGCPAKKVCNVLSGSALLKDELLITRILDAVVQAVIIPVTLKIRTGWDKDHINGPIIAKIAENSGIKAITIHGRTRSCFFKGKAEYETIAKIKELVSIPVIANGDIDTPEKAKEVLSQTKADGIMIGRAARGAPWVFKDIVHYLETGNKLPYPGVDALKAIILNHLNKLYDFYGEYTGVCMARKHVAWYSRHQPQSAKFRDMFNHLRTSREQVDAVEGFFY